MWDAFISYAKEDRTEVAEPLAHRLSSLGAEIWFDQFTLEVGDSLRRSIENGLATSQYGVVILSPWFFKKQWPQTELNGLFSLEAPNRKVILPVWHEVTHSDIVRHSPILADRLGISTSNGLALVASKLISVIKPTPRETRDKKRRKKQMAPALFTYFPGTTVARYSLFDTNESSWADRRSLTCV